MARTFATADWEVLEEDEEELEALEVAEPLVSKHTQTQTHVVSDAQQ